MKKVTVAAILSGLFLIGAVPCEARGSGREGGSHGGHGSVGSGGRGFHGHGFRGGHYRPVGRVFIGVGPYWGPYWGPWYPSYYPPAYYDPAYAAPVVVEPQSYIHQTPAPSFWYFCEGSQAYYPYVQECPGGWLTVTPSPTTESQK